MKTLILSLLFLIAACSPIIYATSSEDNSHPTHYAAYQTSSIQWDCQSDTITDTLIWIRCLYKNTSQAEASICSNLTFVSNDITTGFISGKKLCTGSMLPNSDTTLYFAFYGIGRERLTSLCGTKLLGCYLSTFEVK